MSDSNSSIQVGPGLPGLLFITFLVLKLTDVIDWSWWWVTAPLWGGLVIAVAIISCFALFAGSIAAFAARRAKKVAKAFDKEFFDG